MADYTGARRCFQENVNLIGPRPMDDPQPWNLNNGLEQFATAVHQDFDALDQKLNQILAALRQR